jgi:hypothetical protein
VTCESALRSDNRSVGTKDARDLALIGMDLVQLTAVEARRKRHDNDEDTDCAPPVLPHRL